MYKLFVETTSRRARIVPGKSRPGVAERVFGELSTEDALANRNSLEDAVRSILAEKGIKDADLYSITLPDNLLPNQPDNFVEDNKGPITEDEKAHDDVKSKEQLAKEQEGLTAEQAAQKQDPKQTSPKEDTKNAENEQK